MRDGCSMVGIGAAGRFALGSHVVHRMGYGAMHLTGPGVFGPPRDPSAALDILREAVGSGVDHIDTSDYYGPHITNQLIRQALQPYPSNLVIVTKIGAARGDDGSVRAAAAPHELSRAVHDNLRNLNVDVLEVVNFRVMINEYTPAEGSIEEQFTALAELQRQGLIRHLGISHATAAQVAEARRLADVVCVQNYYNFLHRLDDALIDHLAAQGIAYVPYRPLGNLSPVQSATLGLITSELDATPKQIALAWLLQRSPNILLIPGTSSIRHLHENLHTAALKLPKRTIEMLDAISTTAK
jgi:pyridoxine 4-dehydrogenase